MWSEIPEVSGNGLIIGRLNKVLEQKTREKIFLNGLKSVSMQLGSNCT